MTAESSASCEEKAATPATPAEPAYKGIFKNWQGTCAWLQRSWPENWGTGGERTALSMSGHHPIIKTMGSTEATLERLSHVSLTLQLQDLQTLDSRIYPQCPPRFSALLPQTDPCFWSLQLIGNLLQDFLPSTTM